MDIPEVEGIVRQLHTVVFPQFREYQEIVQNAFSWFEAYKAEVNERLFNLKNGIDVQSISKSESVKRRAAPSSSDEEASTTQTGLAEATTAEVLVNLPALGKRNASKMACLKINSQSHMKLNSKLRRPDRDDKENRIGNVSTIKSNNVIVKIEKPESTNTVTVESLAKSILIDTTNEMMPPPAAKLKRGRKKIKKEVLESSDTEPEVNVRTTRSKRTIVKKENLEKIPEKISEPTITEPTKKTQSKRTNQRVDSDIIIQEILVPLVTIYDSEDEPLSNIQTAKKQTDSEDAEKNSKKGRKKKTKVTKKKEKNILDDCAKEVVEQPNNKNVEQEISMYEDAISEMKDKQLENPKKNSVNATITNENNNLTLNTTKILTKMTTHANSLNNTHVIHKDSLKENGVSMNSTHILAKESPQMNPIHNNSQSVNCSVVLHKLNDTQTLNLLQNKSLTTKTPDHLVESPLKPQIAQKPSHIPLKTSHTSPESPEQSNKSPESQKHNNILKPTTSKAPKPDLMPSLSNLLTDDDDSIEVFKTPEKKINMKKPIKTKPMFSPYADSPVKKRVAAFEKLGANDEMPVRVTRTKTRNMAAKETQSKEPPRTFVKPKFVTPLIANIIPSMIPHTDSKMYQIQHNLGSKYNSSSATDVFVKSSTSVKPSRAELQERREEEQKRRLGKEDDAKRKKEQMMLAKTEEQRRKREEKQAKAQKTREALEKEKEEKLRQMILEKEQKQLEEIQKKREWELIKAAELEMRKKKEEQLRQQKIREHEARRKLEEERKQRLNVKPPPLPTEDWEDSDSSSETVKPRCLGPIWGQRKQLEPKLLAQRHIPKSYIETYFQMRAQTPDLREIFATIDERALRRNSSAVWRTPPRYSTLPKF